MTLTCCYSSLKSDGRAYSQVTGARVHVPLGHEPFGRDAMPPALALIGPDAPIDYERWGIRHVGAKKPDSI
jgi:hypothetical protein